MVVQRICYRPGAWHWAGRMWVGSQGFPLGFKRWKKMGWCSRNNRNEVPCIWQPPPLKTPVLHCFGPQGGCALEFISSLIQSSYFLIPAQIQHPDLCRGYFCISPVKASCWNLVWEGIRVFMPGAFLVISLTLSLPGCFCIVFYYSKRDRFYICLVG